MQVDPLTPHFFNNVKIVGSDSNPVENAVKISYRGIFGGIHLLDADFML